MVRLVKRLSLWWFLFRCHGRPLRSLRSSESAAGPPQFPRIQKGKVEGCEFFLCSIEKYEWRGVEHIIFKVEVLIIEKKHEHPTIIYFEKHRIKQFHRKSVWKKISKLNKKKWVAKTYVFLRVLPMLEPQSAWSCVANVATCKLKSDTLVTWTATVSCHIDIIYAGKK